MKNQLTDHSNLTYEQKEFLGKAADALQRKESIFYRFNNEKVKRDFIELSYEMVKNENRIKDINGQLDSYNIPSENLDLLNKGVYTGLINSNKLTYVAYYE